MKVAFFSIVSNNYLHFARTLMQSVAAHHPDFDRFCVIVDEDLAPAHGLGHEFATVALDDLGLPDQRQFCFQYSILELNTAVKPWAFKFLMQKGYDQVIYIDPDIKLYAPLTEVFTLLQHEADLVVTPHLLSPISDDLIPTELDIRRAGTYNFGFCGLRNCGNAADFIAWWQTKLVRDCVVDMDRGVFVDQSWIDLVPGMFPRVGILRHPGYNVAYWNLAQRKVARSTDGRWSCDGVPLVFFHFSGLNPLAPQAFSKHQNRFNLSNLGPIAELVRGYAEDVCANGAQHYTNTPYGFAKFADGTRIPDVFRRSYLLDDKLRAIMGANPFGMPHVQVQRKTDVGEQRAPVTWAMHAAWSGRKDLSRHYHLDTAVGATQFLQWFVSSTDSHFSPSVVAAHQTLLEAVSDDLLRIGPDSLNSTGHTVAEVRLDALFLDVLGRHAGPRGRKHMLKFCANRLGAACIAAALLLTPESRARPHFWSRGRRAIRRTLRGSGKLHTANASRPGEQALRVVAGVQGMYPPDADSQSEGMWCSSRLSLPLPRYGQIRALVIEGSLDLASHSSVSRSVDVSLDIRLDDDPVSRRVVSESGSFHISIDLPAKSDRAATLGIDCSSEFVPAKLGVNSDTRQLAWRVKRIVVDAVVLVDCGRSPPVLRASDLLPPTGINIVGYLASEHGVGEAARLMAKAARAGGIPFGIVDVGYQAPQSQRDRSAWEHATDAVHPVDIVYVNADQTSATLNHLRDKDHSKAALRIGFWHWEQPALPERYLSSFDGLHEVWTPSAFVHEAVSAISPVPVFKVPHAVEFSAPGRSSRAIFGIPDNAFAVLVMYDFHSYTFRKNPDAALKAFRQAFSRSAEACLVIKTINSERHPKEYAKLKEQTADLQNVVFIDRVLTREEIYDLEACSDTMVSLHRAEGFGLGLAEMMRLGKPVIGTGWSGNMEFMNSMNSYPVGFRLTPLAAPLGVYEAGQVWAEPDVDEAARMLAHIASRPGDAATVGGRAQAWMEEFFSAQAIGNRYRARLSILMQSVK